MTKLLLQLVEGFLNYLHAFFHAIEYFIHRECFFFTLGFRHPRDVEIDLITLQKLFSRILAPATVRIRILVVGLLALRHIIRAIAGYEVVEVLARKRIGNQCVLDVGAIVVVPNVFRRLTLRKEQHVRLNALGEKIPVGRRRIV